MGDYDFEPTSARSSLLKLKSKGESVKIRIASKPYREPKVWKAASKEPPMKDEIISKLTEEQWFRIMGNPDYTVNEVFSWIVIDRTDGRAKIFSGAPSVYKAIQSLAKEEAWGDPTHYDIKVTRTEEPGRNYYKVDPLPDKSELTEREKQAIEQIDIESQLPNARALSEKQIDNIDTFLEQNENQVKDSDKETPQTSIDSIDLDNLGEEVDIEDIPF